MGCLEAGLSWDFLLAAVQSLTEIDSRHQQQVTRPFWAGTEGVILTTHHFDSDFAHVFLVRCGLLASQMLDGCFCRFEHINHEVAQI